MFARDVSKVKFTLLKKEKDFFLKSHGIDFWS